MTGYRYGLDAARDRDRNRNMDKGREIEASGSSGPDGPAFLPYLHGRLKQRGPSLLCCGRFRTSRTSPGKRSF